MEEILWKKSWKNRPKNRNRQISSFHPGRLRQDRQEDDFLICIFPRTIGRQFNRTVAFINISYFPALW